MIYTGDLYGKHAGKYFPTGATGGDWDRMREALRVIAIWAKFDHLSWEDRQKAMKDIEKRALEALEAEE